MTTLLPRNNHVLILPDEGEAMRGKLFIPESAVKIPTRGTVVAVGPGYLLEDGTRGKMDLEVDDRVEFHAGPGHPIREVEGMMHFILKEEEVIAKVIGEPPAEMALPGDGDADGDTDDLPALMTSEEEDRILAANG